jgi:hypothetical protein
MTKEQIERARLVSLGMNTYSSTEDGWDGVKRYFNNGDIVSFTSCYQYMSNAKFEINDDPNWCVWFSQLNLVFLDDKVTSSLQGTVVLLDGTVKEIPEMRSDEFYSLVRGKKFRVEIESAVFGAFNVKSQVWNELPDRNYYTAYKYVVECIESGNYNKLRDLFKGANSKLYDFIEVP